MGCPFVNQYGAVDWTQSGSPIQPSNGVIPKRSKDLFKAAAELILPAEVVGILVGLGVEEKPLPEAIRVEVPDMRHPGVPAASR